MRHLLLAVLPLAGCALFTSVSSEVKASAAALEVDLSVYAAVSTAAPGIDPQRQAELGKQLLRHVRELREGVE